MRVITALLALSCLAFSAKQASSKIFALTNKSMTGGGTAFLLRSPKGKAYLVTNKHVCNSSTYLAHDDHQHYVQVIEKASFTDLCLLLPPEDLQGTLTQSSKRPAPHDPVYVMGYGLLLGSTLTVGHYVGRIQDYILGVLFPSYFTAPVLPGNSGSPVLNEQGEVVGVVFASSSAIDNRTLAVPLSDLEKFMENY